MTHIPIKDTDTLKISHGFPQYPATHGYTHIHL